MIYLTAEQAQQIEDALDKADSVYETNGIHQIAVQQVQKAIATIRAARAHEQNPVAWYDKINGMEVSVDVSTGEDDIHHRIFGRVDGVMLQSCGAQEDTILVIEDSRNFAAPVRTKDLTDDEIHEIINQRKDGLITFARAAIAADRELNK